MASDEVPEDDNKKKFREALERKKAKTEARTAHTDGGLRQPKAHGAVDGRREFRRKSI